MTSTHSSMAQFLPLRNISFLGGDLTSDAGAISLLDFALPLLDPFKDLLFADSRIYCKEENENFNLLKQCVFRYLLGYNTQNCQEILRNDPLLSRYFPALSSQSSISRLFQRITEKTINQLWSCILDQSCNFLNKHCSELILEADSTIIKTYGKQEESDWIKHYSEVGYHPLIITESNTHLCLGAWLRPGNTHSAREIEGLMELVLERLFPSHTVRFRADSAFYHLELMELLEAKNVSYAIRVKNSKKLKEQCLKDFEGYKAQTPFIGEIEYTMSQSSKARRICYEIKTDQEGKLQIGAVITNLKIETSQEVIEFYRHRATSENDIKELKNGFGAKTLSHRSFISNAFDLMLKTISYNIFKMFSFLILEGRDQKLCVQTWRLMFQKIAAKIVYHQREIFMKMARGYPWKDKFIYYLHKVRNLIT